MDNIFSYRGRWPWARPRPQRPKDPVPRGRKTADPGGISGMHQGCAGTGQQGCRERGAGHNGEEFGAAPTMIIVHEGFIDLDMLVETDVDAIVH
ncbi:uncharacterized protein ATNIH1004_009482 [Aspergillus tanneri]|uniref:Uncharacterized protein n=1 Tax=Aspergillus tanneri TaxID=1220188 RepID=A0A5M9MBB9_9EURO|nr:uncharacterized protein ATNIH1004_009482 [Aspergillus tanneri]KAA8642730.1 hypothetical protein ATNIH1004_009482 [Aspergillus tanneri]